MSLLFLKDRKSSQMSIIQWFSDPTHRSIEYPAAPLLQLDAIEFRSRGFDLLKGHLEELKRIHISGSEAKRLFEDIDQKAFLKRQVAIMAAPNTATEELHIEPVRFRTYSLGGMQLYDKECRHILRAGFSPEEFWIAFDAALRVIED
jgi:hypothetical protein